MARYQDRDAASQAHAAQVADGASQIESAAEGFYDAAESLYAARRECAMRTHPSGSVPSGCPASTIAYLNSQAVLNAAYTNTSDRQTRNLLAAFTMDAADDLANVGSSKSTLLPDRMIAGYYALVARCGQLIQGR